MYLCLNVAAHLNGLFNLFTKQPLLPLLARILKKNKEAVELQVIKGTRDLFGKLLFCSETNSIDLGTVFSFLILPEPACFAYPDGTIRQNDKSAVFHHVNENFYSNQSVTIETAIGDGIFVFEFKDSKPSQNIFSSS